MELLLVLYELSSNLEKCFRYQMGKIGDTPLVIRKLHNIVSRQELYNNHAEFSVSRSYLALPIGHYDDLEKG